MDDKNDHPGISEVEARNAMEGLAQTSWIFFAELLRQGFTREEAFNLLQLWMNNTTLAFQRPTPE